MTSKFYDRHSRVWSFFKRACPCWLVGAAFPLFLVVPLHAGAQGCLRKGQLPQSFADAKSDTRIQQECERAPELIRINRDNMDLVWQDNKVLMLSWLGPCTKSVPPGYITCLKEGARAVLSEPLDSFRLWLTAVPQVRSFLSSQPARMTTDELVVRLQQYLGLEAKAPYQYFAEIWVDPSDLMRPCQNPDIDAHSCDPIDPARPLNGKIQAHLIKDWPFTGLGYTYDWGSRDTDIGATEFVIKDGAKVTIKRIVPTEDCIREARMP